MYLYNLLLPLNKDGPPPFDETLNLKAMTEIAVGLPRASDDTDLLLD
jgi:hypothetical protein